ncbi:hypothetical protein LB565_04275 [Mesorhizobium sp. CA14]|uniref:hypothetical protein n=1 Tax=Mesorhizobium sp. CA14 TaxID=2876642 RepID=UPI001CC985CF|nr:hypothetical protein [Mesorhizobium sp. CA14]MBZ9847204.1 hypothetical protein [Mesorhizobium sp. CA14]
MTDTLSRIRRDHRVELVDDERHMGNGVIVTLRQGWTFEAGTDNRVRGEDTVTAAFRMLTYARPFDGPYDP